MREKRSRSVEPLVVTEIRARYYILEAELRLLSAIEGGEQIRHVLVGDRFVERDDDAPVLHRAEIDPPALRFVQNRLRASLAQRDTNRVEVILMHDRIAESAQSFGERGGEPVHAPRNSRESLRSVINRVHA